MKHNFSRLGICVFSLLFVCQCGFNDLPKMKTAAVKPFKDMLLQYRLRSDVAYLVTEKTKKFPELEKLSQKAQQVRAQALAIALNLDKYDHRQANRFQSYQNFLSRDMTQLIQEAKKNKTLSTDSQFNGLLDQWGRLDQKLVLVKREYLKLAKIFNQRKKDFPHTLYNKYSHKLDELPMIDNLAGPQGAQ